MHYPPIPGNGCRAIRAREVAWWTFTAGTPMSLGLMAIASAAHQSALAFTHPAVEGLARAATVLVHTLAAAALAATAFRYVAQQTAVTPLTATLAWLALLRFVLTEFLAMTSALSKVRWCWLTLY